MGQRWTNKRTIQIFFYDYVCNVCWRSVRGVTPNTRVCIYLIANVIVEKNGPKADQQKDDPNFFSTITFAMCVGVRGITQNTRLH